MTDVLGVFDVDADVRWRLRGGAWVVRLVAVFYGLSAAVTLFATGSVFARTAALSFACAALLWLAASHLERGSRVAACALLAFFLLGEAYVRLVEGRLSTPGMLFDFCVLAALGNAAWGAFALDRARRAAAAPQSATRERDIEAP